MKGDNFWLMILWTYEDISTEADLARSMTKLPSQLLSYTIVQIISTSCLTIEMLFFRHIFTLFNCHCFHGDLYCPQKHHTLNELLEIVRVDFSLQVQQWWLAVSRNGDWLYAAMVTGCIQQWWLAVSYKLYSMHIDL